MITPQDPVHEAIMQLLPADRNAARDLLFSIINKLDLEEEIERIFARDAKKYLDIINAQSKLSKLLAKKTETVRQKAGQIHLNDDPSEQEIIELERQLEELRRRLDS